MTPNNPRDVIGRDERMLAAIEEDIKLGHRHIARLEQLIDERRRKRLDTSLVEEILQTMRTCAVHHEAHRALLLREIARASLAQTLYSASKEAIAHSRKLVGGWPPELAIARSPSSG